MAQTTKGDPRITRVGVGFVIRRTNIDELPQFLNVLNGDMPLVGLQCQCDRHAGPLHSS
ncbi:sugar transferase [Rhizobium sp. YS-1r]|uniref:sugar transferase n=1 Tax=Rhizobium sp. YS-1r TaxID=1532558 RepID=UPI000A98EDF9|nr:sugar transferase [Rhizobium sp. YS-1r]